MAIEPHELVKRLFPSLNDEERAQLVNLGRVRTYPPDTILCHEGAYESVFYVIAEGEVIVTKKFDEREELVLRHTVAGEFFGEMAIIQDAPRSATVTTVVETTVLELDKSTVETMLGQNPSMALAMIRTTFDRLRANDQMAIRELR
ncbi:MAG: cyclic nucleotide-binding domain-containing protein, partial [Anaerolineae bacterium]|nr:cyclic nucleotide-binding domain-containing protein [Anaerolineae bacterium]